jgi:hypothetical protein
LSEKKSILAMKRDIVKSLNIVVGKVAPDAAAAASKPSTFTLYEKEGRNVVRHSFQIDREGKLLRVRVKRDRFFSRQSMMSLAQIDDEIIHQLAEQPAHADDNKVAKGAEKFQSGGVSDASVEAGSGVPTRVQSADVVSIFFILFFLCV